MKKLIVSVSILTFFLIGSGLASASSILINGSAEYKDLTGWTAAGGYMAGEIGGVDGDGWAFQLNLGQDGAYLSQTGTTGLTPGYEFELSGYYYTDAYDYGSAEIIFYDASNGILQSYSLTVSTWPTPWQSFELTDAIVPEGAAYWEVKLVANKNQAYGNYADVHWDALSLTSSAVPIPTTILLLGSGIFGLAGLRRRLKK